MTTKKDYALVAIIGVCFGLFAIPILKNIEIGVSLTWTLFIGLPVVFAVFAVVALWIAAVISKRIPIVLQLAKYGAVGAFNTFLDWGVLNILIAFFGVAAGIGFAVFKGTSFIISNIGSYFWNRYWTFGERGWISAGEYGKFFAVSLVGLGINIGLASVVVNYFTPPAAFSPERWANVGAAVATIGSLVWNFIGYKFFVFKKPVDNRQV